MIDILAPEGTQRRQTKEATLQRRFSPCWLLGESVRSDRTGPDRSVISYLAGRLCGLGAAQVCRRAVNGFSARALHSNGKRRLCFRTLAVCRPGTLTRLAIGGGRVLAGDAAERDKLFPSE